MGEFPEEKLAPTIVPTHATRIEIWCEVGFHPLIEFSAIRSIHFYEVGIGLENPVRLGPTLMPDSIGGPGDSTYHHIAAG